MHLQESEHYEHDLDVVIDMLLDDDYQRRKIIDLRGGRNYQVLSHKKEHDFFHMKVQYDEYVQLPPNFPARYKKYVNISNTYITTVEWQLDDSETKIGNVIIEIPGLPLTVYGHLELKNCSGGCERVVEIEIDYKLPIIGRYISRFFSGFIQQSLTEEYEYNCLLLAQHKSIH
ncbi:MAG: DUF2505 domain-containing protein [Pseudomonadales bacterium]|nr:DUF2505 domain-containing protein [Pseudomonadales bacterium]